MNHVSEALESKHDAIQLLAGVHKLAAEYGDTAQFQSEVVEAMYLGQLLPPAEPYFWSREITDAVLASSKLLPMDTSLSLTDYHGAQNGWFWFENAVEVGYTVPFRGLLWGLHEYEENGIRSRMLGCITFREGPNGHPLPCEKCSLYAQTVLGDLSQPTDPKYTPAHTLLAFLLTALLWIDQRVLIGHPETADRATRRRLTRLGVFNPAPINVVRLRRAQHDGDHATGDGVGPREWSCQWVVRGHWRQQIYRSTGEHRPLWIVPYVKGPEDKPLKPPAPAVFAVTR